MHFEGTRFVEILMSIRQLFFLVLFFGALIPQFELFVKVQAKPLEKNLGVAADSNSTMTYADAFIYGLVEGITEFLPISSTGHLVLTKEWMTELGSPRDWNRTDGTVFHGSFVRMDDRTDAVLFSSGLQKKKKSLKLHELSPESRSDLLSLIDENSALDAYLIVIQAGAIFAVTLIYRKRVWSILLGFVGMDPKGKRLGINLLFAFLPAALLGPFLDDTIESFLFGPIPIAFALFAGAILMYWVEHKRKKANEFSPVDSGKSLDDLTIQSSLLVGCLQCFAMWPGTSRSMMTIVGGYLVGLTRAKAAEFSFLLGLITLSAAAAYKCLTKWEVMERNLQLGPVFAGCLMAGISAAVSVVWLVGYLSKRGLGIFVWYRIALSMLLFVFYFYSLG